MASRIEENNSNYPGGALGSKASNGTTEGFNHALRSILWRAFGMTNFSNFRLRALHRFGQPANA